MNRQMVKSEKNENTAVKTILYLATTANGLIAGEKDDVSWVSKNQWKNYGRLLKKTKHAIVGRKTYQLMSDKEFFPQTNYYVLTRKKELSLKGKHVHVVKQSPQSLLRRLKEKGIDTVCICGGGTLNASFMNGNHVDEAILDIEPIALGKGTNLFHGLPFEAKLKLLHLKTLPGGTIRVHYQVKKTKSSKSGKA